MDDSLPVKLELWQGPIFRTAANDRPLMEKVARRARQGELKGRNQVRHGIGGSLQLALSDPVNLAVVAVAVVSTHQLTVEVVDRSRDPPRPRPRLRRVATVVSERVVGDATIHRHLVVAVDAVLSLRRVGVHGLGETSATKWLMIPSTRLAARFRPASNRHFVLRNHTLVASSAPPHSSPHSS
jgi:hypothetical protein